MNIITRNEFINACKSVYPDCKFTNGYGHILNTLNDPDTNAISACLTDHISINENFAHWVAPEYQAHSSNVNVWYGAKQADKCAHPADYDELVLMLNEHRDEVYAWFGETAPDNHFGDDIVDTPKVDTIEEAVAEAKAEVDKVRKVHKTEEYNDEQLANIIGDAPHSTRHLDATFYLAKAFLGNVDKREVIPAITLRMYGEDYDLVFRTDNYIVVQVRLGVYRVFGCGVYASYKKVWECWLAQTLKVVRNNIKSRKWFPALADAEPKSAPTYEDHLKSLSNEELIKECLNWYKRVEDNA